MARATPLDAIGTFVAKLEPDIVGHARLRRRLAEEMTGHLEDATERHHARGLSLEAAQAKAIEEFGPPEVVLGTWAESKGVGVPTTFTRFAGLAGVVGAAGLGASMLLEQISRSFRQDWFAEAALTFGALFFVSLVALYLRVRGKLVPYGRTGTRLALTGIVIATVSTRLFFGPGVLVGVLSVLVGLAMFLIGALRTGVVPRGPIRIWIAGLVVSMILAIGGTFSGVDVGRVSPTILNGAFALGWIWLGAHLWSEQPSSEVVGVTTPT
ncbi:MAG TPA: permease prefix domain 1-containing protein [Actinomycetota bacterium]|nr:permease prefix domain 1-containing protein [Actinomycetota bacterium]